MSKVIVGYLAEDNETIVEKTKATFTSPESAVEFAEEKTLEIASQHLNLDAGEQWDLETDEHITTAFIKDSLNDRTHVVQLTE